MEHPVCGSVVLDTMVGKSDGKSNGSESGTTQSGLADLAGLRSCKPDLNLTEGMKNAGVEILSAACTLAAEVLQRIETGRGALKGTLSSLVSAVQGQGNRQQVGPDSKGINSFNV